MSAAWKIRSYEPGDLAFLEEMSLEAFYSGPDETPLPLEEAMKNPLLACWLEDFGREGDTAFIGLDDDGRRAGVAYYRSFTHESRSYGFIHPDVPEVAIAVRADLRGSGLGTVLLRVLLDHARAHGVERLSLSVAAANLARRLYERVGFREAGITMVAELGEIRKPPTR